jgi:hypothetical protein
VTRLAILAFAACVAIAVGPATPLCAEPPASGVRLAALAPADDARRAIAIGAGGEVFEPDGKGAWVHRRAIATADRLTAAGRVAPGGPVVAIGDGVVYRLASNGWSAIRLVQRGKAILGNGARSLAAVGRQLFALDTLTRGEPTKLALAPAGIVAIGSGARGTVIATDTGAWRFDGKNLVALDAPPRMRLVSDRWAIVDRGALDLSTLTARPVATPRTASRTTSRSASKPASRAASKAPPSITPWPGGVAIGVAGVAPDGALIAIGAGRAGLELLTLRGGKLARDPLGITGSAVGVVVDRAGRAAVALIDGRIALRDKAGWTTTEVTVEAPTERPGPPPAPSR